MALLNKLNQKITSQINTGFGVNADNYGGRFVKKDGNSNIEKRGLGLFERISWFHSMLTIKRWQFLVVIFFVFVSINLFFAIIYYIIGIDHLGGVVASSKVRNFAEAFFFSCQTFTTVGYGRVNPLGMLTSSIAAFEALIGLLSFALATGLLYGRFAKPKAFLRFSENALIAPYKDMTALMFRVAPYKNTNLIDAEVKVMLGLTVKENGKISNQFFQLPLEFNTVNSLNLSWTIVHPINEDSPLYDYTQEDFNRERGEIVVYLKAFDDMFSNTVVASTSYIFKEIVYGAKFNMMYKRSQDNSKTTSYLDKLNSFSSTTLPERKAEINEEIISTPE